MSMPPPGHPWHPEMQALYGTGPRGPAAPQRAGGQQGAERAAAVTCPSCGGTARQSVTPNLFTCTSVVHDRVPTGVPHPSLGPLWQDVARRCGREYQAGGGARAVACYTCGLDSIGTCQHCQRRFCGKHASVSEDRFLCQVEQLRRAGEAHRLRTEEAAARAAERDQLDLSAQAAAQEARRAHGDRRRANMQRWGGRDAWPGDQADVWRRIRQLEDSTRERPVPGGGALLGGLLASPFVVLVVGSVIAQGRTDVSPGPFVMAGLFATFALWCVLRMLAIRHNARRGSVRAQIAEERSKLGCGELSCKQCQTAPAFC